MRRALVVALALGAGLIAPALAHAAPIARPNPVLVSVRVDYVAPLQTANGAVATLPALDPAIIKQALIDHTYLAYQANGDLGGFLPAPIGQLALSGGPGRNVVGTTLTSQLPQYGQAGNGSVQSFAFTGPPTTPPDNGTGSVPGLGTPPPVTPPTNTNTVPPPNQGFGGTPPTTTTTTTTTTGPTTTTAPPTTTAPTTTTTAQPPPTTTTTPTTTAVTTTTATTTTTAAPPPNYPPAGCGTIGLSIISDQADCRIYAINMSPGDSASEQVTITNTSGQTFALSLKATGTQNRLWDDLEMGVWPVNTAAPSPLPSLLLWTTQYNQLTTLSPGQVVTYEIELYLPPSAGNADQGLAAVITFNWRAGA